MNPTAILQSDVLDIIFENRNKDYGAYSLRKYYNNRLGAALMIMFFLVVLFSLVQFFMNKNQAIEPPLIFKVPDHDLVKFENKSKAVLFPPKQGEKIKGNDHETTPQIEKDENINKSSASIEPQIASEFTVEGNGSIGSGRDGNDLKMMLTEEPAPVVIKKEEKPEIYSSAAMPQYPCGLKALLAFLKSNIHSPEEVTEGNEISVIIRFVVNINGQLESFKVMESGGEVFDNEVIRVLKKMPRWIPGRNAGEKVSVYYTVPVRFRSDF